MGQRSDRQTAHTYWVEVAIDNRERKIPIDADEVIIKRTYHCGTDREEFHVNGSTIAQRDLFGLLESANAQTQFQIIEQGKVQQLVERGEDLLAARRWTGR